MTAVEGLNSLDTVRHFFYQQQELPEEVLGLISRLESLMISSSLKKKQSHITDFFKKG